MPTVSIRTWNRWKRVLQVAIFQQLSTWRWALATTFAAWCSDSQLVIIRFSYLFIFFVSLSFPIRLEVSTETLTWCVVFNEQNFPSFLLSFFPSFRPSFLIYRFIFFSFSVDSMWRLQRDDMTVIRHFGSMIWRWRLNRKSFSEEMALKDRPLLAATPQRKSN